MKGKGSPAILHIDIETSPILSAHWQLFDVTIPIDSIVRDWHIISIAYNWHDEDEIHSLAVNPSDHTNDLKIVRRMHELISAADIVVAHNGDSFDMKKFMARAIFHDLPPPEPCQTVDTLKVARRVFKFTSNKMDYIGRYLKLGQKIDTPKGLWMKACFGTLKERREAIHLMAEYNRGDVDLLKKVYIKLRPYMANHPHHGSYHPGHVCRSCGSEKLKITKTRKLASGAQRKQFQCKDCGSYTTGKLASKAVIE